MAGESVRPLRSNPASDSETSEPQHPEWIHTPRPVQCRPSSIALESRHGMPPCSLPFPYGIPSTSRAYSTSLYPEHPGWAHYHNWLTKPTPTTYVPSTSYAPGLYEREKRTIRVALRLIGSSLALLLFVSAILDYRDTAGTGRHGHSLILLMQLTVSFVMTLSELRLHFASLYERLISQMACLKKPWARGIVEVLGGIVSYHGGFISRYVIATPLLIYGFITLGIALGLHYHIRGYLASHWSVFLMASDKPTKEVETFTMTRNGKEYKMMTEIPNYKDPYNISLYCCPTNAEELQLLELAIRQDEMEIQAVHPRGDLGTHSGGPLVVL